MKSYKFSVIIPIYKAEKYLFKAVSSVENQIYKNFEIILVDDGSPDGCPKICDELSQKYSNIIVIHQKNSGVSVARNVGIAVATGDVICFLDADDEWLPTFLEELNQLYNQYPDIGSASTARYDKTQSGKLLTIKKNGGKYIVFKDVLRELNYLRTSTYSVKTNAIKDKYLFMQGIKRGEDIDFQLRIACHYKHGFINIPLAIYNVGTEFNSDSAPIETSFPYWKWYEYEYSYKDTLYIYTTGLLKNVLGICLKQRNFSYALLVVRKIKLWSYIIYKLKDFCFHQKN